jgi:hypothetical protein
MLSGIRFIVFVSLAVLLFVPAPVLNAARVVLDPSAGGIASGDGNYSPGGSTVFSLPAQPDPDDQVKSPFDSTKRRPLEYFAYSPTITLAFSEGRLLTSDDLRKFQKDIVTPQTPDFMIGRVDPAPANIQISNIPEPLMILTLGLGAVAALRSRKTVR